MHRDITAVQNFVAENVRIYGPKLYHALHIDDVKDWFCERALMLQQDLIVFEQVAHIQAVKSWLRDRSVDLQKQLDAQRKRSLRSSQELLQDAQRAATILAEQGSVLWGKLRMAVAIASSSVCEAYTNAVLRVSLLVKSLLQWCALVANSVEQSADKAKQSMYRAVNYVSG
jgi:hypothetical protein